MSEKGNGEALLRTGVSVAHTGVMGHEGCCSGAAWPDCVTQDDKDSLLLSFSPSTGNISVVKEIVDKLLKGYDVRLRPDFGGMVTNGCRGRAQCPSCVRAASLASCSTC